MARCTQEEIHVTIYSQFVEILLLQMLINHHPAVTVFSHQLPTELVNLPVCDLQAAALAIFIFKCVVKPIRHQIGEPRCLARKLPLLFSILCINRNLLHGEAQNTLRFEYG